MGDTTLIFNYFSIPGISILSSIILIVLLLTTTACYFDLKSRQAGLNFLPEGSQWVSIPKKRLVDHLRTSGREQKTSQEEELPLLTPNEPSIRSSRTPFTPKSNRPDHHEKHHRMIEAVYIASGRNAPPRPSNVNTAIPKSGSDSLRDNKNIDETQRTTQESTSSRTLKDVDTTQCTTVISDPSRPPLTHSDKNKMDAQVKNEGEKKEEDKNNENNE